MGLGAHPIDMKMDLSCIAFRGCLRPNRRGQTVGILCRRRCASQGRKPKLRCPRPRVAGLQFRVTAPAQLIVTFSFSKCSILSAIAIFRQLARVLLDGTQDGIELRIVMSRHGAHSPEKRNVEWPSRTAPHGRHMNGLLRYGCRGRGRQCRRLHVLTAGQ
jgi:hypothetical protein